MKSLLSAFASLILLLSVSHASIAASYQEQKVVYHMNYGDSHRIAETMVNISNHLSEVGDERVDIKVVVHGKAIEYFLAAAEDEAKQMTIDSLRLRDVQFIICGNSLDGYKVTREDLYEVEEEDVVKAGLPAIVDLQQKGYIYVRP
ncbi:DsrE family protein [Pontibacterium sp.]|uniref:DsrE family protein n=1 Tax=Pontibacterium sp. TaxID=2036026 RepID=UPI0035126E64